MVIESILSFLILGVIAQLLSYFWIRCSRGKRGGGEKENQKAKGKCQKAKVNGPTFETSGQRDDRMGWLI
jgi:hypothetical protein